MIHQEINLRGPLTFADFVDIVLYHPKYGYYNQTGPRRGRSGDYFTSLQVSPLFAEILADAILEMQETLGTEQFSLIELGSGDGELLENILRVFKEKKMQGRFRVWAVERSIPARDNLWKRLSRFPRCEIVSTLDEIEWMGGLEGCVLSNEWVDALSFHRLRRVGGAWREIYVTHDENQFKEMTGPLSALVSSTFSPLDSIDIQEGHEIEFRPAVSDFLKDFSQKLNRGYVLTVDYGHPRSTLLHPSRSQGTWQCYFQHQANRQVFDHLGEQDITAHVDFSDWGRCGESHGFESALFASQGVFLSYVGQKRIEQALATATDEAGKQVKAALQQLLHPDAMGEKFWVLVQKKEVDLPPTFLEIPNRNKRLLDIKETKNTPRIR